MEAILGGVAQSRTASSWFGRTVYFIGNMSVGASDQQQTSWAAALRLLGAWTLLDVLCNART
ncbi:MAG: hypothetical protein ABJA82_13495, partial [Myxococcales bacterium]